MNQKCGNAQTPRGNLPQAHSRTHFGECTTRRQSKNRRRANRQGTAEGTKTSQAHTSLWKAKHRPAPQTANNAVSVRWAQPAKAFFAARHCRAPKPVHRRKHPAQKIYSKVRSPLQADTFCCGAPTMQPRQSRQARQPKGFFCSYSFSPKILLC